MQGKLGLRVREEEEEDEPACGPNADTPGSGSTLDVVITTS